MDLTSGKVNLTLVMANVLAARMCDFIAYQDCLPSFPHRL